MDGHDDRHDDNNDGDNNGDDMDGDNGRNDVRCNTDADEAAGGDAGAYLVGGEEVADGEAPGQTHICLLINSGK